MLFIYSLKNEDFLRTIHITKVKENTFYQHLLKNEMLTQECCAHENSKLHINEHLYACNHVK